MIRIFDKHTGEELGSVVTNRRHTDWELLEFAGIDTEDYAPEDVIISDTQDSTVYFDPIDGIYWRWAITPAGVEYPVLIGKEELTDEEQEQATDLRAPDVDVEAEEAIKAAMSILGSRTSERKAASSRANGKKGGRPRKQPQ